MTATSLGRWDAPTLSRECGLLEVSPDELRVVEGGELCLLIATAAVGLAFGVVGGVIAGMAFWDKITNKR
jgi:hypothetical protein